MNRKTEHSSRARGKLKIGDDWNAITIIALSQTSPLKAIAELVENSIDSSLLFLPCQLSSQSQNLPVFFPL